MKKRKKACPSSPSQNNIIKVKSWLAGGYTLEWEWYGSAPPISALAAPTSDADLHNDQQGGCVRLCESTGASAIERANARVGE